MLVSHQLHCHAVASGTQLLDLVNDLLALHGTVELERQRFNLHEVLSTHAEECAAQATAKSIGFHLDMDPSLPRFVIGDRQRLMQVLTHLTSNAFRST